MLTAESRLTLPPVPADQASAGVAAWSEPLVVDTYLPGEPDRYPAFLDSRVYQGSSGRVFPLPFHERIDGGGRRWCRRQRWHHRRGPWWRWGRH